MTDLTGSSRMVAALYSDVRRMVYGNATLLHPRTSDSTFRRLNRYIFRNKAKIFSGGIKTVAAGLLTGGAGAAAMVGGLGVSFAGMRIFRAMESGWASWGLNDRMKKMTIADPGGTLSSIATLCSNNSMTDIMNSFAELEADAKALSELMPGPAPKRITSCDEAWTLLEHLERVYMRGSQLSNDFELLGEFVFFARLLTSSYEDTPSDDYFEPLRRQAVLRIIDKSPGATPEQRKAAALRILNAEANSAAVFHSRIFSQDFSAWIKKHNPEFQSMGSASSNLPNTSITNDPTALSYLASGTALNAASIGASTGAQVGANALQGNALMSNITTGSQGMMGSAVASIGASASSAGVGVVADAVLLSLQSYIDKRLLDKNWNALLDELNSDEGQHKTIMQVFSKVDLETVSSLRTAAKKILRTAADKMSHLIIANNELKAKNTGATSAQDLARALARRQKLQDQVAGLLPLLYMFYESTVARSMGLINSSRALDGPIRESIAAWIDHHRNTPCDHGNAVCYMDASAGLLQEIGRKFTLTFGPGENADGLTRRWAGLPIHPGPSGTGGLRILVDKYM